MSQGWLIVERLENWEVDANNHFTFFGLSSRYRKFAAEIQARDSIICYVSSGLSVFSDIRTVQDAGMRQLKDQSYDSAFPYSFSTAPVLVLPREKWVPLKEVAPHLDLTRGRTDYRPLLQISLRKLTAHDTIFLEAKLRAAVSEA